MTTPEADPRYDALTELALGTLPDAEREALEAWLAGDSAARAQYRAICDALGLMALAAPDEEPPAHLRDRVLALAGTTAARPTGHVTPSAPRLVDSTTSRHQASSPAGARGARIAIPWLIAAAATLVALGLGWQGLRLQSQVERLEAELQRAMAQLATIETDVKAGRARLARAQTETAILAAADLTRTDLTGQTGAPQATARVFWSRAQGLVLTASRLPELPQGRTYQLWVLTAGAPVSAGLFTPDAAGGASAVFDTPVSLPTPTGLAVSIEPEGGVPAPTGAIVLVGKAG